MNLLQPYLKFAYPYCFASPSGDGTQADPGNGTGGDGGSPSPEGGATASPGSAPEWNKFLEGLGDLKDTLAGKLDGLTSTVVEGTKPAPVQEQPPDFDAMSQAELHEYTLARTQQVVMSEVTKALAPIQDMLTRLQTDFVTNNGKSEITRLQTQHKDYMDFKDEMIGLAKEQPSLGLEDIYRLAKARNPEKARTLEAKYNPPPVKPRMPFSLGPGDGGRGNGATTPLTAEEAGRAAYNEVAARHPGVLAALESL